MGEARDLEKLAAAAPDFDIIIDDASHAFYHQQLAFRVLFPRLADGGLYIIEDPHWQPPFEGDLPPVPRTGELLSRYFENLEYLTGPVLPETFLRDAAADIGSFSLFPAFAGHPFPMKLIVLRKRKARSDPPPAKTIPIAPNSPTGPSFSTTAGSRPRLRSPWRQCPTTRFPSAAFC
jgi:hypothetical protein